MPRPSLRLAATLSALAGALLLGACAATPEAQLRSGLMSAGLSKPMAVCMAHPMAQQLSLAQLMKLRSLSRVSGMDIRKTSYDQLLHRLRALNDPVIVRVTTSAAVGCYLG